MTRFEASLRVVAPWVLTHGVRILVIIAGATLVVRAANLAIERLQHRLSHNHQQGDFEWQRRASTLGGILTSLVTVIVLFVRVMMLLREPRSTSCRSSPDAGIAGLAIGFGAQNLVRDVIFWIFRDSRGPGLHRRPRPHQRHERRGRSRLTFARSSCATSRGPCKGVPRTARLPRSPTSASSSPLRLSISASPTGTENSIASSGRAAGSRRGHGARCAVGTARPRDAGYRRCRIARGRLCHMSASNSRRSPSTRQGGQRAAAPSGWRRSWPAASSRDGGVVVVGRWSFGLIFPTASVESAGRAPSRRQ